MHHTLFPYNISIVSSCSLCMFFNHCTLFLSYLSIVPELVPANVTSISSTSVTLHWVVKPSLQFQLPILHYNLSYSSNQLSNSILLPSNTSMHKLTGLIPGSRYTLSLSAYNRLGEGPGHQQVVATLKGQAMCMLLRTVCLALRITYTRGSTCRCIKCS